MKPDYWDRAKRALARKDPVMAAIIRSRPKVFLARRGEPFVTLARAIVGQQISVKAAQSVWDKVCLCAGAVTPRSVLARKRSELRACGLSERKVEYIADLAQHFLDGAIHVQRWPDMDDEAVIAELTQVRGIGRWTAEMFLIFSLLRPDVFPIDELGLQKGIRGADFRNRRIALKTMLQLGDTSRTWRSVATWYLWRSLDPLPVEY